MSNGGYLKKQSSGKTIRFTLVKVVLAFFLVCLIIVILLQSDLLNVKSVIIKNEGQIESCIDQNQLDYKTSLQNQKLFFVNAEKIKNDLTKRFACLSDVKIVRKFPQTIELILIGRVAKANIITGKYQLPIEDFSPEATASTQASFFQIDLNNLANEQVFLTDEDGILFKTIPSKNQLLPEIFLINKDFKLGDKIGDGYIKKTLEIIQKLNQLSTDIKTIKIIEKRLEIEAEEQIIFSLEKDYLEQLASLQLILQKAKMNSGDSGKEKDLKIIEMVDLRFEKPVVRYLKRKS